VKEALRAAWYVFLVSLFFLALFFVIFELLK